MSTEGRVDSRPMNVDDDDSKDAILLKETQFKPRKRRSSKLLDIGIKQKHPSAPSKSDEDRSNEEIATNLFKSCLSKIGGWVLVKVTDLMQGDLKDGKWGNPVWYTCPGCKQEVWAIEWFAGCTCFMCWGLSFLSAYSYHKMEERDPTWWDRPRKFFLMHENGKALHPKSTYIHSNFRVLYKQVTAEELTDERIINILVGAGYDSLAKVYKASKHDCLAKKCVELWTEWSALHHRLTNMLIYDKYDDLKTFMPIIRGITSQIVSPSEEPRITYRGSKIFMKQFETIQVGTTYRIPQILATSMSEFIARSFCEGDCVMVKFVIPMGCWNAASICDYSSNAHEEEVLFPPYTAIKITNKEKESKWIECEVLDNANAPKNVESRLL